MPRQQRPLGRALAGLIPPAHSVGYRLAMASGPVMRQNIKFAAGILFCDGSQANLSASFAALASLILRATRVRASPGDAANTQ
jgi:hypothetical protein